MSLITGISIAGVGLGVTAMIVVLSVMDGFERELRRRLMASDVHILLTPQATLPGYAAGFAPASAVVRGAPTPVGAFLATDPRIESVGGVIATEAILRTGRKVTGAVVKGVGPERLARLKAQVTESIDPALLVERSGAENFRHPGVYVGQELAYEMGLIPGDFVTLISPTEMDGPMSNVPRTKRFVVEGVYRSGIPEQELHTVFAEEAPVRSFLRRADVVSQWEVNVRDFDRAPEIAAALRRVAPDFKVRDWFDLNAQLFASLKLERIAMFASLAFIVLVASFNIVSTLTLMVLEKRKEIAILKAMGARDREIASVFVWEGLFIGGFGIGGGALGGLALCLALRRYEFIQLPEFYYDRTLPVTFDPFYYAIVMLAAALIVLLACLQPARRAARQNPLDGIRYG